MKTSNEMFIELGFILESDTEDTLTYHFEKNGKKCDVRIDKDDPDGAEFIGECSVSMDLIYDAIDKLKEELGLVEDE